MRYISIPIPVALHDPLTKQALVNAEGLPETWDFGAILNKLMANPKWAETFANMRSQEAIENAFEESKTSGVMALAEEDWVKLKDAAETPKTQINTVQGAQLVPGYGVHPSLSRQLISLVAPIIEAKHERPKP